MSTISAKLYVQWVQRTLNRKLESEMITDGNITPEYREAVETFQLTNDLPVNGNVGPADQDKMIKVNHKNNSYVNWIQEVLRATGVDASLPITGSVNAKTKQGIQSFQAFHDLRDDGWVGPRTEIQMIESSGLVPAGQVNGTGPVPRKPKFIGNTRPKPFVLTVDRTVTRIISAEYYHTLHNRSGISGHDQKKRLCLLGKLKQRHGIDDRYPVGSFLFYAYNGSQQYSTAKSILVGAREFLNKAVSGLPGEKKLDPVVGRNLINQLISQIKDGLQTIKRHRDGTFKPSPFDSFAPILKEVISITDTNIGKSNSVLSCFR